ncbi:MAG: BTAD domain-containing putative transcriptional regulator, partial [Actinoplanes sp.]
MDRSLRLLLLGPVDACRDGEPLPIGSPKRRLLLAVLAMRAGHVTSTAELVDALWTGSPPASATENLRSYIHDLRRVLGAGVIAGHGRPGYTLDVPADALDLTGFLRLADQGEAMLAAGDAAGAGEVLRRALGLWRGPAYEGLEHVPALQAHAAELEERRLGTLDRRFEADLRAGAGGDLVAELTALVGRHPYRERFHGHLMTALYRDGRQADALTAFRAAREMLVEDLGVEPGPDLLRLHAAILRGDLPRPKETTPVPAELPFDVARFTGRAAELDELDAVLSVTDADPSAVGLAVVAGMAGV